MRTNNSNPKCLSCADGMNRFCGRWCNKLGILVQYKPTPPCEEPIFQIKTK